MKADIGDLVRFLAKRKTGPGCWEWTAHRARFGHGVFQIEGRNHGAHRMAWFFANDEWPGDRVVRHKCDNPWCVRPDHLEIGTKADNNADRDARGRQVAPKGIGHGMHKLADSDVLEIRANPFALSRKGLAARFCVTQQMISLIVNRKNWRHLP